MKRYRGRCTSESPGVNILMVVLTTAIRRLCLREKVPAIN